MVLSTTSTPPHSPRKDDEVLVTSVVIKGAKDGLEDGLVVVSKDASLGKISPVLDTTKVVSEDAKTALLGCRKSTIACIILAQEVTAKTRSRAEEMLLKATQSQLNIGLITLSKPIEKGLTTALNLGHTAALNLALALRSLATNPTTLAAPHLSSPEVHKQQSVASASPPPPEDNEWFRKVYEWCVDKGEKVSKYLKGFWLRNRFDILSNLVPSNPLEWLNPTLGDIGKSVGVAPKVATSEARWWCVGLTQQMVCGSTKVCSNTCSAMHSLYSGTRERVGAAMLETARWGVGIGGSIREFRCYLYEHNFLDILIF